MIVEIVKKRKLELIITFAYLFSFGLSLFNQGIFWDDWVWINRDWQFFSELGQSMGSLWVYNWSAVSYNNILLTRVVVLLTNAVSLFSFNRIIRRHFSDSETFVLTLFFAIIPANILRSVACVSQYSLCLMLFMLAFFLLVINQDKNKLSITILSLILFFLSFDMNSLIFFYLVPALYIWWQYNNFRNLSFLRKYFIYLIPAIVFVALKLFILSPQGSYEGYNTITISGIIKTPVFLGISLYNWLINFPFTVLEISLSTPLILLFSILFCLLFKEIDFTAMKANKGILVTGLLILVVSFLPYILVGKYPTLTDWENRHSVMASGALSLMLYSAVLFLFKGLNKKISLILFSVIVSALILFNFQFGIDQLKLGFKTDALKVHLQDSEIIEQNTTFLFVDDESHPGVAFSSGIDRFYVLNGILYDIFGDETRFMFTSMDEYELYKDKAKDFPHLRYSEWAQEAPQYSVYFRQSEEIGLLGVLKNAVYSVFVKDAYKNEIRKLYSMEIDKI